jgi:hypothetical protein
MIAGYPSVPRILVINRHCTQNINERYRLPSPICNLGFL